MLNKKRQLNNKIILNIKSKKININNAHLVTGDVWLMWKFLENSSEKNISIITNNSICVEQKLITTIIKATIYNVNYSTFS